MNARKGYNLTNKQLSERNVTFAEGGEGTMFTRSGVGAQEPGVTATTRHGPTGKMKASRGGKTKMFGKQSVKAAKPV